MGKKTQEILCNFIMNKSENATLLLLVKMTEKRFLIQFLFL